MTKAKPTADSPDGAKDILDDLPRIPKTRPAKAPDGATDDAQAATGAADSDTDAASTVGDAIDAVTKKELFARVKARTGKVKGSDVRAVMDAVLDELGASLVAGEALKVPALGTLKVQRHKVQDGADIVVCKLRRKKHGAKAKDPLAKPVEEG